MAEIWSVIDTNAHKAPTGSREHDIGPKKYSLTSHTGTDMPMEHAVNFLRDPSFIVTDADGEVVGSLDRQTAVGQVQPRLQLKSNQVIATLDELSNTSLLVRANEYPEGKGFKQNTKKETLIAFLTDQAKIAGGRGPDDAAADAEDPEVEDVPDNQIPKI